MISKNGINESWLNQAHMKTTDFNNALTKLNKYLNGLELKDVPLDFISTQYFTDLYILESILGSGSFGVVLQVVERKTGQELAIKVYYIEL